MAIEIDEVVQDHEKRINALEVNDARLDERLDALVKSTNNLKWATFGFAFIMLLTIIYGALGPTGFNAVTEKSPVVVTK